MSFTRRQFIAGGGAALAGEGLVRSEAQILKNYTSGNVLPTALVNLFPNQAASSFNMFVGETAGARLFGVSRKTPGSTLSMTPNDGFVTVSGANVVAGSTPTVSTGTLFYTITETMVGPPNSGLQTSIVINVVPADTSATIAAAGYRVASANNAVNGASLSIVSNRSRFKARKRFKLGRSAYTSLRFGFCMWRIGSTSDQEETTPPNAVTIPLMSLEIPGAPTPVVAVTFGASRTHTFLAGQALDFSDEILPAAFGLSNFEDSSVIWFRWYYDLSGVEGAYCPDRTSGNALQSMSYDPVNEAGGGAPLDIDSQGAFANPTGAQRFSIFGPNICVGKPVTTSIPSVLVIGDSIADAFADDGGDGEAGGGYLRRGTFLNGIPTTIHALGGRSTSHWINNHYRSKCLIPFHNRAHIALGTNDVAFGLSLGTFLTSVESICTDLRTGGIGAGGIVASTILPRTSNGLAGNADSTLRATDLVDQHPYFTAAQGGLGFELGGTREQINAALISRAGNTTDPDVVFDLASYGQDGSNISRQAVRAFSTTLAASSISGAATLSMTAAPAVGETFVLEPLTGNVDPLLSNTTVFTARTVTGTGPFTVALQFVLTSQPGLSEGALPSNAHANAATVHATNFGDETHPSPALHITVGAGYRALWAAVYAPYSFVNAEASAYVALMTSPPSDARRLLIDTFIGSLKSAGVYSILDALYLMAAHDAQAATLNIKGGFTLGLVGSPTWTVNRGYTGNGSSMVLTTGITPSVTPNLQFVLDSAHIGAYVLTDSVNTNFDVGSGNSRARLRSAATTSTIGRVDTNATTITAIAGTAAAPRHVIETRTASTTSVQYINGAADGTSAGVSNGLATSIEIFRDSGSTFSDRQIAIAHLGGGLTAGQASALNAACKTYLQGIGCPA